MKSDMLMMINQHPFNQPELIQLADRKIRDDHTPVWEKSVFEFIRSWFDPSGSIIQYSSGTTGKSKKIILPKRSMWQSAENTCRFFDLKKGQTAVLCLPVDYIAGKMMIVRCLAGGLNLQLAEPRSKPDLRGIDNITFCAMVPLQVINTWSGPESPPAVQTLIIGGAEISRELEDLVRDIPVEVYATYGMAETCSHIALRKVNGENADSWYQALPGIDLETDTRNCLVIRAAYLPAAVVTHDVVELAGNGRFRWLGRYDNLINSGGIKIAPEEIESVIAQKYGMANALIGLPDIKLGQRLVLVMENIRDPKLEPVLKLELEQLLPPSVIPKSIIWIEKFPRNKAFKIDRPGLVDLVQAGV
jgi:o-succinylbenzoate---CoA ligase